MSFFTVQVLAFDGLGIVAGVLGIAGFIEDHASKPQAQGIGTRIAAGMNGFSNAANPAPLSGAEGQTPRVIIRAVNHEVTADNGYRLTQKPAPGFSTAWRVVGHNNGNL